MVNKSKYNKKQKTHRKPKTCGSAENTTHMEKTTTNMQEADPYAQ